MDILEMWIFCKVHYADVDNTVWLQLYLTVSSLWSNLMYQRIECPFHEIKTEFIEKYNDGIKYENTQTHMS